MQCTIWNNTSVFLKFCYIKTHEPFLHFKWIFCHAWFCKSIQWLLENIGTVRSSKCWHVQLHNVKILHLLMSPSISSGKKCIKMGRCQVHGDSNKSSKILIFICLLKYYHWQQLLLVIFLKVTVLLHSFSRKCLSNIVSNYLPIPNSHSLSLIFFR